MVKPSVNPPRVVLIVQARMGSTRLPGKTLKKILGKTILSYLIQRLKLCHFVSEIIIATTDNPRDDEIVECAGLEGVPVVRGSEEDVLSRFQLAARQAKAEIVVRVTADCPLIDPKIIDHAIDLFKEKKVDYLSNVLQRTYPRGFDVEVFSRAALEKACIEAKLPEEREHVTVYFYRHPEIFNLANFEIENSCVDYRWTLDTPEDFEVIKQILEKFGPKHPYFSLEELLEEAKLHPEWKTINQHIEQKVL